MASTVKGWRYEVERGVCSMCGEVDSVISSVGEVALCEHCTASAGMAWRRVLGEVPPGFPERDVRTVSSVSVVVARRSRVRGPQGVDPPALEPRQVPSAYEFLMVPAVVEGTYALPSYPVVPGSSVRDAAAGALASVGLRSWPDLLETLHVGYTPRGRLAAYVLARGYAARDSRGDDEHPEGGVGEWRPWPASAHAGRMAGAYEFLEAAWPLRLYRLCVPGDRLPSEISVSMREVARRYVDMQSAKSGARSDFDGSMLDAYRAAMTADELALAEVVRRAGEAPGPRKLLAAAPVAEAPEPAGGEGGGSGDSGGTGADDEVEGGEVGGGGEQPPEPGFARRFRGG